VTLDRLQKQVLDVYTVHVDCWLHPNDFRILYKLLESSDTIESDVYTRDAVSGTHQKPGTRGRG